MFFKSMFKSCDTLVKVYKVSIQFILYFVFIPILLLLAFRVCFHEFVGFNGLYLCLVA